MVLTCVVVGSGWGCGDLATQQKGFIFLLFFSHYSPSRFWLLKRSSEGASLDMTGLG